MKIESHLPPRLSHAHLNCSKPRRMGVTALMVALTCLPKLLLAAVDARESFEPYSAGGLADNNGGIGWAVGWLAPVGDTRANVFDSSAKPLTFTPAGGLTIAGELRAMEAWSTVNGGAGNNPAAARQLAVPLTNTFFVRYLLRYQSTNAPAGLFDGNNTFSLHLATSVTGTASWNLGVRGTSDTSWNATNKFLIRHGTSGGPADAHTGGFVSNGVTHLLVAQALHSGSGTFDTVRLWVNPAHADFTLFPNGHARGTLAAGSGPGQITHLFFRSAANSTDDRYHADEIVVGGAWDDVVPPGPTIPAVTSFTLMYPGTAGPVPGYDPLTNSALINLLEVGANLSIRANTTPTTDFGSVQLNLSGATPVSRVENDPPWALFGDTAGDYTPGQFNAGSHTLTATPYDANGGSSGGGTPGNPLTISFTVTNFFVGTNNLPTTTLTSPTNGAAFTAPAEIQLVATASDSDGLVTKVEFYAASTKIGEAVAEPYTFLWTNVTTGVYRLTARAVDDEGGMGISPAVTVSVLSTNTGVVTGELKKWHRVSVTWDGPDTHEQALPNPFRDYRLDVRFTHPASGKSYLVPGFYAADGNAAETSATNGNKWRVHFAPDELGEWHFVASFRGGLDVAVSADPLAGTATAFDGAGGRFVIGPSDKTGRDFRAKGRLQYVGKHHLQFAGTGEFFLKNGVDAPENLLAYHDIDGTPNTGNRRKSWHGHTNDFDLLDAGGFTWQGGKGYALLGGIKYLRDKGLNAFSFLTFNMDGDDDNVFPHLLVTTAAAYEAVPDNQRWNSGTVYKDRFDVSKLEQWDRVFAYGTMKGMYLHFKTQETENELLMDGGNQGIERSLYYRELIARFGYHLALNWNLGEEIDNATTGQKQAWSQYIYDHDPYRHHQVIHPGANHYDLLGNNSKLTGFSLQTHRQDFGEVHQQTTNYLWRSLQAGKPWVVACDEPGDANHALVPDSDAPTWDPDRRNSRQNAMWGHYLAGGAGLEWYFGYGHAESDLNCQDWRSRDLFWDLCRHALEFFTQNAVPFWNMSNHNALLTTTNGWCLSQAGGVKVVFLKAATNVNLHLTNATGNYTVQWFDPRNGGSLQRGTVTQVVAGATVNLGWPPASSTEDWVALVRPAIPPAPELQLRDNGDPWQLEWTAPGFVLDRAPGLNGPWSPVMPPANSPFVLSPTNAQEYFRLRWTP